MQIDQLSNLKPMSTAPQTIGSVVLALDQWLDMGQPVQGWALVYWLDAWDDMPSGWYGEDSGDLRHPLGWLLSTADLPALPLATEGVTNGTATSPVEPSLSAPVSLLTGIRSFGLNRRLAAVPMPDIEANRAEFEAWLMRHLNAINWRPEMREWYFKRDAEGNYAQIAPREAWATWQATRNTQALPETKGLPLREAAQYALEWLEGLAMNCAHNVMYHLRQALTNPTQDQDLAARFQAQHDFLKWNRALPHRPIVGAVEYHVFDKALEFYHTALKAQIKQDTAPKGSGDESAKPNTVPREWLAPCDHTIQPGTINPFECSKCGRQFSAATPGDRLYRDLSK